MPSWHILNVGKPVEALPIILEIKKGLLALASGPNQPTHIEVLQAKASSDSEQLLYFCPEIEVFAKAVEAKPCSAPDRSQCTKLF